MRVRTLTKRFNQREKIRDHFATPMAITRLLLERETFEGTILEPAAGERRAIVAALEEAGYDGIQHFDLHDPIPTDFLSWSGEVDNVITNPPFSQVCEFWESAADVARRKIAFLMPLNFLTGKDRYERIWSNTAFPLARVYVLSRGIDFRGSDPFGEGFKPSQLYCAWCVWERGHEGEAQLSIVHNQP